VAEDLRMALQELLRKAELDGDVDFLRDGVRVLAQELMEIEVAQHVGAEKYERGTERTGERNGYRDRPGTRALAASSCACRGCAMAATTQRCLNRGDVASGHSWR
jgi:transposase-like protein